MKKSSITFLLLLLFAQAWAQHTLEGLSTTDKWDVEAYKAFADYVNNASENELPKLSDPKTKAYFKAFVNHDNFEMFTKKEGDAATRSQQIFLYFEPILTVFGKYQSGSLGEERWHLIDLMVLIAKLGSEELKMAFEGTEQLTTIIDKGSITKILYGVLGGATEEEALSENRIVYHIEQLMPNYLWLFQNFTNNSQREKIIAQKKVLLKKYKKNKKLKSLLKPLKK